MARIQAILAGYGVAKLDDRGQLIVLSAER
jgi:hypothetical protein